MAHQLLDATSAEVAYRVEQLRKTGHAARTTKKNRVVRWLRAHRLTSVAVPAQQRRSAGAARTRDLAR